MNSLKPGGSKSYVLLCTVEVTSERDETRIVMLKAVSRAGLIPAFGTASLWFYSRAAVRQLSPDGERKPQCRFERGFDCGFKSGFKD